MKRSLLECSLGLAFTVSALAADAVFSPDGQSVTFLPPTDTTNPLWRVDLNTKVIDKIQLNLPWGQTVRSLACGAEGETLVLTGQAVYVHDAKGTRRLCDTGEVHDVQDLATAPPKAANGMADWLIVTGIDKDGPAPHTGRICYARKPGEMAFVPVFSRRIDKVGAGAFTPNGRYFFQADDALWEGHFSFTPDDADANPILDAVCIARLEYRDSSISNTGMFYASNTLAAAGERVYVALGGRHGDDRLLRVTMPAKPPPNDGTDSHEALVAHYAMESKVLSSAKVLDGGQHIGSLAATLVKGEERVFYLVRPDFAGARIKMMLWSSRTGKPEVIGEFEAKQ